MSLLKAQMVISQLLRGAIDKITQINQLDNHSAKFEAQLLLLHVLSKDRAWLITHENDAVQNDINEAFQALLNRRLNGEPIAHILGYREFYDLHLKVTADTLIPRPDTETLVEAALSRMPLHTPQTQNSQQKKAVLDLGTGSGAIALAIAKNRPLANVFAVDVSQAALNVAIANARNLNISNVQFILSDWLNALKGVKFDLIVSNPPYIEDSDTHLQQGDLRFEPLSALASGRDGLDDIRQIINHTPQHLNAGGWLMLEHGYNQADHVASLLRQAGYNEISHALDLSGIKRVTIGQI